MFPASSLARVALPFAMILATSSPALSWEREGYGCAAAALPCPAHLTPADAQIVLGFGSDDAARAYWQARFGAPGGQRATVTPGTYQPLAATRQIIPARGTCNRQTGPASLSTPQQLAVVEAGLLLNGRPLFRYDLSESDFLLITGLCGQNVQHDGMSIANWLGPTAIFASDDPPDQVGAHSGYWLIAPDGRMAAVVAAEHSVIPISAGGTTEGWVVTVLEYASGGNGGTVVVGGGPGFRFGGASTAPATGGGSLPVPPDLLPPLQVALRLWSGDDPCNSLRRIADALDLIGQGALLPDRPEPGASPARCAQIYDDLRNRLSGVPATDTQSLQPVFLWTLPQARP